MSGELAFREVLFRTSEEVPILPLPETNVEIQRSKDSAGGNMVGEEEDDFMDVEFVVRGDLDGDGNQELILASMDGSLVIIKSRGRNQYHFQYPGKLPVDSMICGIDIGPIYHHHHTEQDGHTTTKITANGVYVLTLDGTLLILSCEELKFLPSSPHYGYASYDTSDIDSGSTKEVQKSIFTGVAVLRVLLEIGPDGASSSPMQPPIDLPSNCTCLRVLDDKTCDMGNSNGNNDDDDDDVAAGGGAACSVIIAMGARGMVHLYTHDLLSMSVRRVCQSIEVDTDVHSLDLCSHQALLHFTASGSNGHNDDSDNGVRSVITNFLVVGLKNGAILCWKLPVLRRLLLSLPPLEGRRADDDHNYAGVGQPDVIWMRLGSGPPAPSSSSSSSLSSQATAGPAYVRVLPASPAVGVSSDGDGDGGCLYNQSPYFLVAWLDGRFGICRISAKNGGGSGGGFEWCAVQCMQSSQTLYKADYFHLPLFPPPAPHVAVTEEGKGRIVAHWVSCAFNSWSGCTYMFTACLPVDVTAISSSSTAATPIRGVIITPTAAAATTAADAAAAVMTESTSSTGTTSASLTGGTGIVDTVTTYHKSEPESHASEGGGGGDGGRTSDDSEVDTVSAGEDEERGSTSLAQGGGKDDTHNDRSLEISEHSGGSGAGIFFMKDHNSSDVLMLESPLMSASNHHHNGNGFHDSGSSLLSSAVTADGSVRQQQLNLNNLVYSFDSRLLTGASASRSFCCAVQGGVQALIYVSASGVVSAIPDVAGQLRAFVPKLATG